LEKIKVGPSRIVWDIYINLNKQHFELFPQKLTIVDLIEFVVVKSQLAYYNI